VRSCRGAAHSRRLRGGKAGPHPGGRGTSRPSWRAALPVRVPAVVDIMDAGDVNGNRDAGRVATDSMRILAVIIITAYAVESLERDPVSADEERSVRLPHHQSRSTESDEGARP